MMITVVALMCHLAGPVEVCHEEVVVASEEIGMGECMMGQPAVAQWKMSSKFAGDDWRVAKIRCIPGAYVKRQEI